MAHSFPASALPLTHALPAATLALTLPLIPLEGADDRAGELEAGLDEEVERLVHRLLEGLDDGADLLASSSDPRHRREIRSIVQALQKPVNKALDFLIKTGLKLAGPIIRGLKGISGKVKAKVAAGKAWVKGKAEAGKEWAKGKVSKVKDRLTGQPAAVEGPGSVVVDAKTHLLNTLGTRRP